jgi:hypothetical protein
VTCPSSTDAHAFRASASDRRSRQSGSVLPGLRRPGSVGRAPSAPASSARAPAAPPRPPRHPLAPLLCASLASLTPYVRTYDSPANLSRRIRSSRRIRYPIVAQSLRVNQILHGLWRAEHRTTPSCIIGRTGITRSRRSRPPGQKTARNSLGCVPEPRQRARGGRGRLDGGGVHGRRDADPEGPQPSGHGLLRRR